LKINLVLLALLPAAGTDASAKPLGEIAKKNREHEETFTLLNMWHFAQTICSNTFANTTKY